jgi:hypothetical protein
LLPSLIFNSKRIGEVAERILYGLSANQLTQGPPLIEGEEVPPHMSNFNLKIKLMVTIIDYRLCKNQDGKEFFSLVLEGDITMVQSRETGKWYATAKRATVTSTFSEERAKALIGLKMPGSIVRETCNPYKYVIPETGEEITLNHTYRYVPQSNWIIALSILISTGACNLTTTPLGY